MADRNAERLFEQALAFHRAGAKAEAYRLYEAVSVADPRHHRAAFLLGALDLENKNSAVAARRLERAVELSPSNAAYHSNLGLAYRGLGDNARAAGALRRALQLDPDFAPALYNLGLVLRAQGALADAVEYFTCAAVGQPGAFDVQHALGEALNGCGRLGPAEEAFQRAHALARGSGRAQKLLGFTYWKLGLLERALEAFQQASVADPRDPVARGAVAYCVWFHPDYSAERSSSLARDWAVQHAPGPAPASAAHANERVPERRLRVGYVSPNFRDHCQSFFLTPLFRHHDRSLFALLCYSSVEQPDAGTAWFRARADCWRDVAQLSDTKLAQQIRDDRVDILVDLNLHMQGSRLLAFAEKPAPVQVTWLGYPGSTGLPAMDYRITDPFLDPPGTPLPYSERSLHLPHSFWCYEPPSEVPAVSSLPALESGQITFGSLNSFVKMHRGVLELWAQVLTRVPGSRLLLLAPLGPARPLVLDVMSQHGVGPERVAFVDVQPHRPYLETYARIDIGLDPFPANGHTTSLDSFWMGVPVVTLLGQTSMGRAGLCQAQNLELPELVTHTPEAFVEVCVELARDLPRLSALRQALRERLRSSPLMDGPRFARDLEAAYRNAWREWCANPTCEARAAS